MRRLLPSPLLSVTLFLLWLLLSQSVQAGTVVMGAVLAVLFPRLTLSLRPAPVRLRRPLVVVRLMLRVGWDMLRSNLSVAVALVTRRSAQLPSAFVRIPLQVRDPNALAVLAMIVTTVPGTAWAELAADRSVLMLHVLTLETEQDLIADIRSHYERPLMEIFE